MAGIYVHIPFCKKKCNYCSFISFVTDATTIDLYFQSILREIELISERLSNSLPIFDTIYLGGGTPSLVPSECLDRVLEKIYAKFRLGNRLEISLECNPESVNPDKIRHYMKMGINRISLGVQDMTINGIKLLGRIHSPEDSLRAAKAIRDAGIENLNTDIIFCLPGQDEDWLTTTLERLCELEMCHVSAYELTPEQGTRLAEDIESKKIFMPDDETRLALTIMLESFLDSHGFRQYETSNFAYVGKECRHNMTYWKCGEYLGIGCSAVSFIDGVRYFNMNSLDEYVRAVSMGHLPIAWHERLDTETRFKEAFVIGLRLIQGVNSEEMKSRFGIDPFSFYSEELAKFTHLGLMETDYEAGFIRLSRKGRYIANYILCHFV